MLASPISLLLRCASRPNIAEALVAPWIAKVAAVFLADMYSTCRAGSGGRIYVHTGHVHIVMCRIKQPRHYVSTHYCSFKL